MRSQALDRAHRRIVWLRLIGLLVVLVLAARAGHLTVAHHRARTLYEKQIQTEKRLSAARGTIFDRFGRELAITTEAASIYALPRLVADRDATAEALAAALGRDPARVSRRLSAHDGFTYVARWVDADQAERVRALELPGVGIDREPRRRYPADTLAAPLLGFANIDGEGVRGIEQLENSWLTGQPRRVRVERDARGRPLALRSTDPRDVQGGDVALTLDAAMQGAAEAALEAAVAEHGATGGLVLTLDPKSGDLLALAEAPGFDPNRFRALDYHDTRARAFSDAVEAGSTMKAFLVASALDAAAIESNDRFGTEAGFLRVRGKTIRDRKPLGPLRAADVLRLSSNVGAVQIAQTLGAEAQHAGLVRFGFGARTGSGFPTESTGILRDWRSWQPVDQAAISYGQGVSVTAIQLASALAALANDGIRMEPRLVLARRRTGGRWQTSEIGPGQRAVSAQAARETLDMLRTVVSPEGTGRLAGLADVPVAGKTGTAQKLDPESQRYSTDRYIAWFMGVVPADDPELVIVVAIDEPQGPIHSGGIIAAPAFARVAAAQLARRGIITRPAPIPAPTAVETLLAEETRAAPQVAAAPHEAGAAVVSELEFGIEGDVEAEDAVSGRRTPESEHASRAIVDARGDANEIEPLAAAGAAPPAGPAVEASAAGPSPADVAAFVPDFEGLPLAAAREIAESESLEITTQGAVEGRVVSQSPVPGTVLDGEDRAVRLHLELRTASAMWREEG